MDHIVAMQGLWWLIFLGCFVALWILWYLVVLRPASRGTKPCGPRWVTRCLTKGCSCLGRDLCGVSFAHNGAQFEVDSSDSDSEMEVSEPKQQFVIAFHPHGAYATSAMLFGGEVFLNCSTSTNTWFVCVADLLFKIPGLSEFLLLCNARSAQQEVLDELLDAGCSVALQPGGIYEQVRFNHEQETAYFTRNLGFIRLAMRHGVPLMPAYQFGENQLYKQNGFTRAVNNFAYRTMGVGNLLVIGRCGLPWYCLRPQDVYWVFGHPVDVGPRCAEPTDEAVRLVFLRYVKELRAIFNNNAKKHLPPAVVERGLTVVWREHDEKL